MLRVPRTEEACQLRQTGIDGAADVPAGDEFFLRDEDVGPAQVFHVDQWDRAREALHPPETLNHTFVSCQNNKIILKRFMLKNNKIHKN